jgi:hypothetical protein
MRPPRAHLRTPTTRVPTIAPPPARLGPHGAIPAGSMVAVLKRIAQIALLKKAWDWWQARRARRAR